MKEKKNDWKIRRRIIYATLGYSAVMATYIIISGEDTRLNETSILAFLALVGSVVGSYVFSATWDDKNVRAIGRIKD